MSRRAYRLAALFFFTLGAGCVVCAVESGCFAPYAVAALLALGVAGAIGLGASGKA